MSFRACSQHARHVEDGWCVHSHENARGLMCSQAMRMQGMWRMVDVRVHYVIGTKSNCIITKSVLIKHFCPNRHTKTFLVCVKSVCLKCMQQCKIFINLCWCGGNKE